MPHLIAQFVIFLLFTLLLHGCADLVSDFPTTAPTFTPEQEETLGQTVTPLALQLLGGRYHDQDLELYLNRAGRQLAQQGPRPGLKHRFLIADSSELGLYTLPAGRVIFTRGLLLQLQNEASCLAQLEQAIDRGATPPFGGLATRGMNSAARQVLASGQGAMLQDSKDPAVLLARALVKRDAEQVINLGASAGEVTPALHYTKGERAAVDRLRQTLKAYQLVARARELENSGETAAAMETYLKAATEASEVPYLLTQLGTAYLRNGQLDSAMYYLRRADKLQPEYYQTLMGLGYGQLQKAEAKAAEAYLRRSVDLLPVEENLYLLADAVVRQGRIEEGLRLCRAIVAADGRSKIGRAAKEQIRMLEGKR